MIETGIALLSSWIHSDVVLLWALSAWLATFLAGEAGGIFILTFAFGGFISLPLTVVFIFLGSLSADMFWYVMTTSTLRPWLERRVKNSNPPHISILQLAKNHPYLVLLFIKFLVGLRLMLTIYISARKDIPFGKYLFCNIVANILFISVLFLISAAVNASIGGVLELKDDFMHILTFVVVLGIGSQFVMHIFQKYLSKVLLTIR